MGGSEPCNPKLFEFRNPYRKMDHPLVIVIPKAQKIGRQGTGPLFCSYFWKNWAVILELAVGMC